KLTTTPPDLKTMQKEIRDLQIKKEEAIANQDYETAASFRDKEKKLKDKYVKEEMEWRDKLGATVPEVNEEHIAEIVSSWTGVPVSRLVEEESARLLRMEDEIHARLIGQADAVKVIPQAVRRAHAEVFNMLLQILEDGRLADAKGKQVNFANTIVIMTSNIGVTNLQQATTSMGFQPSMPTTSQEEKEHGKMREKIMDELKKTF